MILSKSSSPIIPSSVEATFQVESTSDGAAVLQCGTVTRIGISNLDTRLEAWGNENKKVVFKMAADAKRFGGFLLVTAIYKTKWCRTRCWSSTSLKSHVGLKFGTHDKASVEESFRYSTKSKDQGGLTFPVDQVHPAIFH